MKKYLLLFLLIATTANAAPPTRQVVYTTGTTIRASDVSDNEDEIFGYLSTGVDTIRADGLDAITEITSALKSGSDQTLITGTEGSNTEFSVWNSDGDLVSLTTITGNTSGIGASVPIKASGFISSDGSAGITNSTTYWLCTNSGCTTRCQVSIKGGIITSCQ